MTTTETAGQTEPTSEVDTDTPASDTTEVIEENNGTHTDGDADEPSTKEAQKYRRRAQAAEAERDQVRGQLDTLQREVITGMCQNAGVDPRLLTAAGYDVAALLDDAGNLDRQKITDAITVTAREFPGRRPPAPNPQQGAAKGSAVSGTVRDTINKALGR